MDTPEITGIVMAAIALLSITFKIGLDFGKKDNFNDIISAVENELKLSIKNESDRNDAIVGGISKTTEKNTEAATTMVQRVTAAETMINEIRADIKEMWPRLSEVEKECIKTQTTCENCQLWRTLNGKEDKRGKQ